MTGEVIRLPSARGRLLTKKQLAAELGRSTRWIELRMREGLPALSRRTPGEHARFDLEAVRAWLHASSGRVPPLEERVARLERQVVTLVEALNREGA